MKKITSILLLVFLSMHQLFAYNLSDNDKKQLNFEFNSCKNIKQTDIPTIFIPWILASWYSEEWFKDSKIKRWIPDPITHVYDTLFKVFYEEWWYSIKDVFYKDQFETYIDWNPKHSLYLFGYDWKKDNKITAKLLSDLIYKIRVEYEKQNWCDIWKVNIIAHSMWWLVARSMLENMCASDYDIKNYYKYIKKWKLKKISSSNCNNYTKINKFITISTPQRGSPWWLPIWTKWDINQTEEWGKAFVLKMQLWVYTNDALYKIIHWYNKKVANWIITIGQLLPDIWNNWDYNYDLLYLKKKWEKIWKENHPQNSFLEELNKKENIEKMFKNILGKYSLYYSEVTWKNDKNNIIWFELSKFDNDRNLYLDWKDKTEISNWIDIYSNYLEKPKDTIYDVKKNIRNSYLLWWDWTVPTKNLQLVSNDNKDNKKIKNNKFENIKVECFDDYIYKKENNLSLMLWSFKWELCSHTGMPISTSLDVYNNIISNNLEVNDHILKYTENELKELYSNIWYLDYNIWNNTKINDLFNKNFINQFEENNEDKKNVDEFIKNRINDNDRLGLKLWNIAMGIYHYEIRSPINIVIQDEKWRRIWINPNTWMIINEIPWAWTSWNTEWSGEPEFFLIPKTKKWLVNHKLISNPTWNWEYHIVIRLLEKNNWVLEEQNEIIIWWEAKMWIDEKYEVNISDKWWSFIKINNKIEEKYKDLLENIYFILDNKYSKKKKEKLKNNLEKVIFRGNKDNKYTDKVFYLVWKIFNYLNKNYE